jgi:hypothetical protein
MAIQQTGTPPNTRRFGIFPDSIRKFVIIFMVILFVIAGIIGIQQAWGNLSNVLAVIFGVVGVILGFLTFWPSTKSNEVSAQASSTPSQPSPVQVNIYNNPGQLVNPQPIPTTMTNNANNNEPGSQNTILNTGAATVQHQPSTNAFGINTSVSPTPEPSDALPQLEDDLYDALTKCLPAAFTKVVRYSHVPNDILSGEDKPLADRADELVRWAESQGDQGLLKLYNAMQRAGVEVSRSYSEPRARVVEEVAWNEPEKQIEPEQKRIADRLASGKSFPNTRRGCVEEAHSYVNKAYDLLDPEMNILPEDIANAAQYLENAQGDIEHLEELLQKNPPHPKYGSIIDQVRIITDQIDHYLIPDLKPSKLSGEDFRKRFGPLLNALKELDTLIPE